MSAPEHEASRDEQAGHWLASLAAGHMSQADSRQLDAWLDDADNAKAFSEALSLWEAMSAAADGPEMVRLRTDALNGFRRAQRRRWTNGLSLPGSWKVPAFAVAASLLVAVLGMTYYARLPDVYETGIGERRVAMLEDGSRLSLDADTEVTVDYEADQRRLTLVRGRAQFEVAKDPLRPFSVHAGNRLVVATGTSFSVELLPNHMVVSLYQGRVSVLNSVSKKPLAPADSVKPSIRTADAALVPGTELVSSFDNMDRAKVEPIVNSQSLSWKSGELSFDDEPLPDAIARINRYNGTKLVIGDEFARRTLVSGVFNPGDIQGFREALQAINGVEGKERDGQIILTAATK